MSEQNFQADVIIVGAGLAGMVAAHEAVQRGRKVLLLDQEAPQSLGGQAFWSLGGLFMVDTRSLTAPRMPTHAPMPKGSSIGPQAACANGVTIWACAGFPLLAGPNAAANRRMGMAIQCRGSTSHGALAPA